MSRPTSGLYESLLTRALARQLDGLSAEQVQVATLREGNGPVALGRHLAVAIQHLLRGPLEEQIERAERVLAAILDALPPAEREALAEAIEIERPARELLSIAAETSAGAPVHLPRPRTRLSESALLTNAPQDERLHHALVAELASADDVDLLCAFVRFNGVRLLEEALEALRQRGGRLRVLTSTYMAGTEVRALDRLAALGAEIHVGYESRTTRLHAKAWLLHRRSGVSTALVGSSNLSHSALVDGLEWNVRLSKAESPHLIDKIEATFESYWQGSDFVAYDPERDRVALESALASERRGQSGSRLLQRALSRLEVRPFPYQQVMLDQLAVARQGSSTSRCLVVAATGTGKTVLAAMDYRRLRQDWRNGGDASRELRLLFVAHRREILDQSLATFRAVLGDAAIGERLLQGEEPSHWQHVFASIQSLDRRDDIAAEHFDVVIVDEFHHAAAATYDRLLRRLRPRHLLGLTATPERTDGQDILHHFGGSSTVELRLWDALDQQLLCPFHYFGVSDGTDLRRLQWRAGGYMASELEALYTADDARLRIVLRALQRKVGDVRSMRAIGFCVSRAHAEYMASRFSEAGIPALAVLGTTDSDARDDALRRLASREVNVLFAVDLYNEGVDVPEVDTLLLLRPTESATLFLQQLGRGLRKSDGKSECTVLDFVGQQHRKFRFDLRVRALTGATRRQAEHGVKHGFDLLPAGCAIDLDRDLRRQILAQIKSSLPTNTHAWVRELRQLGADADLATVLRELAVTPHEFYRSKRSWTMLRRLAFPDIPTATPAAELVAETKLLERLQTLLHIDDPERVQTYRRWLAAPTPPLADELSEREQRLLAMLHFGLRGHAPDWRNLQASIDQIWRCPDLRIELEELLALNAMNAHYPTHDIAWLRPIPLAAHARYTRDEVRAALGELDPARPWNHREGVLWSESNRLDTFFVTLRKDAKHFSPSTSYRDYALSQDHFHWESQGATTVTSPTGRRYLEHRERGTTVALFVREVGKDERGVAEPFVCLGPCDYVRHVGSAPIAITWRLRRAMPGLVVEVAKAVAG